MVITTPFLTRILFKHSNRDNLSDLEETYSTLFEEQSQQEVEWYHEVDGNSISNAICTSEI